jgi:hypothetical protein
MTKAEIMRKTTDEVNAKKCESIRKANVKFAEKLISRKISKRAKKGLSFYRAVLPKKYNTAIIKEKIELSGFAVTESSRDGKDVLMIHW